MTDLFSKRKVTAALLLLVILFIGFYVRYDNINHWLDNKHRYFTPTDNIPVTLAVDSYYYLDIAQDIQKGIFETFDQQRQAPGSYEKPTTVPFLSLTLALVSSITGKPLEWSAILLPPFLGILLAIPVFLLSIILFKTSCFAPRETTPACATISGLVAALFVLISPAFVERSSIGWCDTDILNVTLLCSITLFSFYAAIAKNTRELVFFLSGFTLVAVFFLQWWDQAAAPVTAFSFGYFFLAAMLSITGKRKNGKFFVIFLSVLCLLFLGLQGGSILTIPGDLISTINYTLSSDNMGTHFLYAGQLVGEQQDVSFIEMASEVAGNQWLFYLSLLGVAFLAMITRKYFVFLLPWLILSFLATQSHRLMIFPAVLFGLGMGTLIFFACTFVKRFNFVKFLPIIIVVLIMAWFPFAKAQSYVSKTPKRSPLLVDSFQQITAKVPDASIIWSSWGHGHPLIFYTNARTIGDGIFHPPELIYTQYVPLATNNSRLAANWIVFYSTHGMNGLKTTNQLLAGTTDDWVKGMPALKELLGKGIEESRRLLIKKYNYSPQKAEELLVFLYPHPSTPIFLLLDYVTFEEQWYPWGSMTFSEPDQSNSYTMLPIYSFSQSGSTLQGESTLGHVSFDLLKGMGKVGNTEIQLQQLRADNGKVQFAQSYNTLPWAASLLLNQNMMIKYGALVDDKVLNTVFTKMFFLKEYDKTFFQPVYDESPLIIVYQVQGDGYMNNTEQRRPQLN